MNIIEAWNAYKESGRSIPEFDRALADFARELGVDTDRAVEFLSSVAGPGTPRSASYPFPLIKAADDSLIDAFIAALDAIETGVDQGAADAAKRHITGALAGNNPDEKKALLDAIGVHDSSLNNRSTFRTKLDGTSKRLLGGLVKDGPNALSELKYTKGAWATAGHLPAVTKKMLEQAARGDAEAVDDLAQMVKSIKGREYLAEVDRGTLSEALARIQQRNPGRIDTQSVMSNYDRAFRSLAEKRARDVDPKRFMNQLRNIVGGHTKMDKLRGLWGLISRAGPLLKWFAIIAVPTAIIGWAGNKAYEGIQGPMSDSGNEAPPSPGAAPSGASGSRPSTTSGPVADRVRAKLQQIYEGNNKK